MLGKTFGALAQPKTASIAMVMVTALVLGGGSADTPFRAALIQLLGLALLVYALHAQAWRQAPKLLLALAAVAAVALCLSLVPLPPEMWTHLPGRQEVGALLETAGLSLGWRPFTLSPLGTLGGLLHLIVPLAVLLAASQLDVSGRAWISVVIIATIIAGLGVGMLQLATGSDLLQFYKVVHENSPNGFFANRNHQADLLLFGILLSAALPQASLGRIRAGRWTSIALIVFFVLGILVTRSRAGAILLPVALVGAYLIQAAGQPRSSGRRRQTLIMWGVIVVGALLTALLFAAPGIIERLLYAPETDSRFETAPVVAGLAMSYMPLGTGVGGYLPVFLAAEPLGLVGPTYMQHAHNDYLELWLELGMLAWALLAGFLFWFGRTTWIVWRAQSRGAYAILLARAASVFILIVMIHSVVEYPLRTLAHTVLFAFSCAVLHAGAKARGEAQPIEQSERPQRVRRRVRRGTAS